MVAAASYTTNSSTTTEDDDAWILMKRACDFCDRKACDIVPWNDLKQQLPIKKAVPKHMRHFVTVGLCEQHFWRFITHLQIKKESSSPSSSVKNKTMKKRRKSKNGL